MFEVISEKMQNVFTCIGCFIFHVIQCKMASVYAEAMSRLKTMLKESDDEWNDEIVLGGGSSSDQLLTDQEACSDRDTEVESDYEEEIQCDKNSGFYVGTDKKTVWMKQKLKPEAGDEASDQDFCLPGPRGEAENVTDPIGSWKILFDDSVINKIVECTNANIDKCISNFARERDCKRTDAQEVCAVIGLLYLGGLFKSSHVNVKDLWSSDGTGMSIFHTTMSYKRFNLLLRYMHFEDLKTAEEMELIDNLAPLRNLFETFNANCQKAYSLGRYFTIGNILIPYRGKCKFRQYIPAKSAKYGIKVFPLVDSNTLYTWNMEIYDNKQPEGPHKLSNKPDDIVKRLTAPLLKSAKRNLTADNWFTSYSLAKDLLAGDITMVGVVKQNKPEVPSQFKTRVNCKRERYSSVFGFMEDATLVSYQCEPEGKSTIWLSTMHKNDSVDKHDGKKTPEIVKFYDSTVGAVSKIEEMIACYTTSRITSRWPVVVFFSLLNFAALNARIILMSTRDPQVKYRSRREFLKDLGLALVSDHIKFRSSLENLPRFLRIQCAEATGVSSVKPPPLKKMKVAKKGRCSLCPRSKDKKTKVSCFYCMKLICYGHLRPVCVNCAGADSS